MNRPTEKGAQPLRGVLGAPLAIFLATAAGLAAALLGDGWWRWLSWGLMSIPVAVIAAMLVRKR